MKKVEQTIITILIVICIGMCVGSLIIFISRSHETSKEREEEYAFEEVTISASMEEKAEEIFLNGVVPGLLHGKSFPSRNFTNNSELLTDEIDKFYFVLEYIKMQDEKLIESSSSYDASKENECRILLQNFQPIAKSIWGVEIDFTQINSPVVRIQDDYIYSDDSEVANLFVLKLKSIQYTGSSYKMVTDVYTAIQDGTVNQELVSSFSKAAYISRDYLYGRMEWEYRLDTQNRVLQKVTFYGM